jgi:hypothetical protein
LQAHIPLDILDGVIGTEDRESPSADGPRSREVHNYAPWVNVICGLLVFILRYSSPRGTFSVHWNLFLTGLVIMFAALATTIAHGNSTTNYWSTLNVAAGLWLLVSTQIIPSIPRVEDAQLGLGVLIIVVAVVSLIIEYASQKKKQLSG